MRGEDGRHGPAGRGFDAPAGLHGPRPGSVAPARREEPAGAFTFLDGEACYRISACDRLPPFLMNIPSDTDLWMFLTSRGGLTAGRVDAEGSLFPYETVDRLFDAHHQTGPVTLLRLRRAGRPEVVWEPFAELLGQAVPPERNLYKNAAGNRVIFEEIRRDLGLAFRYRWTASDEFGLVRTAWIENLADEPASILLLDGLRNILPFGIPLALLRQASSLADAYKRADVDPETGLGIFSLTSRIVDRPEAAEQLRANTVWSCGLGRPTVRLSIESVAAFREGRRLDLEPVLTGRRGNYLIVSGAELAPGSGVRWHLAADVGRDHLRIAELRARLLDGEDLGAAVERSLDEARENLLRYIGSADGMQLTGDAEASVHHLANTLFNSLRGGVVLKNYLLPRGDLADFLATRNRRVARRRADLVEGLPEEVPLWELLATAERTGDTDLLRLSYEYLPIHFSRRHGDPSRPWNRFEIRTSHPGGRRALRYEGNWRDLFQNWEALAASFPGFLPGMIAKFVNASTVDGFNPYRITRDGFEWEVVEPNDPWSHIGYWGDHQIIYLLRFLEALQRFAPGALEDLLWREIFSYAEVPYRLRPYAQILENPRATIDYDRALAARIEARVREEGTDGRLVHRLDGSIVHVNLLEKLLVPALSKLSNLVPGGGIWMNTQRPEWNDANNALAGHGLSVVTLCHLRRYFSFLGRLVDEARGEGRTGSEVGASREGDGSEHPVLSAEVVRWLREVRRILEEWRARVAGREPSPPERMAIVAALGQAFSDYRASVYAGGFSGRQDLPVAEVASLCGVALEVLDASIRSNRREDGLYHAYNLLERTPDGRGLEIRRLDEMLEGQVAALDSGLVEAGEALEMISSLFESRLFREDQRSFLLYPERELPSFLERNLIPGGRALSVPLLRELLAAEDGSVVLRDALGACHFHPDFRNESDLAAALDRLAEDGRWRELVSRDRGEVLEVFEEVFRHRSFTGRSGVMYGYEGIGCVYWHMVAKLLLAVQEIALRSFAEGRPASLSADLARVYYRIRGGLGFQKTVVEYGAFPTDPYSHTPRHAGAQQPGMTGQVKEEILARLGELGVMVDRGIVRFRPVLLRRAEFLTERALFRFYDLDGVARTLEVPPGSLAFTYCQTPVVYRLAAGGPDEGRIRVLRADGTSTKRAGDGLDADSSRSLFDRAGLISRIEVEVPESRLCDIPAD